MTSNRYTLVTDGTSDGKMLVPILEWLLRQNCPESSFKVEYADPTKAKVVPRSLPSKIRFALTAHPCKCLFVHRDAESDEPEIRRKEILEAMEMSKTQDRVPHICVIPIRMSEAWLLFEEAAIRTAAGNPNGKIVLKLPNLSKIEGTPDPKQCLYDILVEASELTGRRRKDFNPRVGARRLASLIDDFSPLRRLTAFQALEREITALVPRLATERQ